MNVEDKECSGSGLSRGEDRWVEGYSSAMDDSSSLWLKNHFIMNQNYSPPH